MYKVESFFDDGNIHMEVEDLEDLRFIHVKVKKITPSIVRLIKCLGEKLKKESLKDGYSSIFTYTQNVKFAKLVDKGFEKRGVVCSDGIEYEVLKWQLD